MATFVVCVYVGKPISAALSPSPSLSSSLAQLLATHTELRSLERDSLV